MQPALKKRKFTAPAALIPKASAPAKAAAQALTANTAANQAAKDSCYYTVLYTKRAPNKKKSNKSFADGVLEVKPDEVCSLYGIEGQNVSRSKVKGSFDMPEGAEMTIGNWEVEVDARISTADFMRGACFNKTADVAMTSVAGSSSSVPAFKKPFAASLSLGKIKAVKPGGTAPAAAFQLHSPDAPEALVLNAQQWQQGQGRDSNKQPLSAVVVDPYMSRQLRPHQREGVQFLYSCVSFLASSNHCGAILADEMGLGKTLQIIALIWTLLKQGPQGRPSLKKVIVVTPSSLTSNWAAEIKKWLGTERLKAMILQPGSEAAQQVSDWKHGAIWTVLVVSYESIRKYSNELAGTCGLLICDEGHRLKAAQGNKTIDALLKLGCPRRIILTGTPVQNNLDEFFAMMDFVNPGLLGSLLSFKRIFEAPITKGRDRNASAEDQALGKARTKELGKIIDTFVLRRTSEVNQRYLPCLATFVLFCRPSALQITLYKEILKSKTVASLLGSSDTKEGVLHIITMLKKLCNHPDLLRLRDAEAEQQHDLGTVDEGFHALFPRGYMLKDPIQSGKLGCLSALLQGIITGTRDRAVVVASSTAALDVVQGMCQEQGLTTCRIDGATPPAKRQDIVDAFNHHNVGQVCLLSTTAGGAGLNLTGANHLVLYDAHWNPAMDTQAMARIWRDGQLKPCTIYRLLLTGTIDEKIYQRQLQKGGLAAMMHDEDGSEAIKKGPASASFTKEELRELFRLNLDTDCDTRALIQGTSVGHDWEAAADISMQGPLQAACATGVVSFVHAGPSKDPGAAADLALSMQVDRSHASGARASADPAAAGLTQLSQHRGAPRPSRPVLVMKDDNAGLTDPSRGKANMSSALSQPADDDVGCLEVDM